MSSDLAHAFSKIKSIDSNSTGFNSAESTIPLGFKYEWGLGSNDGHHDFIKWLDGYLVYANYNLYLAVYGAFIMAKEDAKQAYQPCVLYALKKFHDMGNPEMYLCGVCDDYYEQIEEPAKTIKERIALADKLVIESCSDYLEWKKTVLMDKFIK